MTTASQPLDADTLAAKKVADGSFELDHHDEHGFAHVSPISTLLAVFFGLVCLTVITWAVAFLETGSAEILIAMVVATIKAALVCTWFMHLRYDKPLNTMLFVFSTFFLALFLVITISDVQAYENQLDAPSYPENEPIGNDAAEAEGGAADSMEGAPES